MNKKSLLSIIALAIVALYIALVAVTRWGDGTAPRITLADPFTLVGPATPLSIHIEDEGTGLQEVSIRIVQNLEEYTLAEERFPSHGALSLESGLQHTYEFEVIPFGDDTIPKRRGPATLLISARDYSWRGFFEGNWTRFDQEFTVKFTPPRLEALSSPLPVSQGGAGVVFYRVSDDAKRHGVTIGEAFFPGSQAPGEQYSFFSMFAFPHNTPVSTPIQLMADDGLGNHGLQTIPVKVQPKTWRTRKIKITDRFIQRTVLPIIDQTPELEEHQDPLKNFLQVNNVLRQKNTEQLKTLSTTSQSEFLWKGAFVQLSNSQVEAAFADHRNYVYGGQIVDTQDHLGFDLAVTKQYPVEAANHGIVVMAEYFGIYGNTIVLDHGYGLQSLYAHLSSFEVSKGDYVRKGQMIARSGMTGLAAGDHLHFSLLLHGVQINPIEWWDPQWVQTRMSDRLRKNDPIEPERALSERLIPMKPFGAPEPFDKPRTFGPGPAPPPPPNF